jgi:Sulfotransferase family
MTTGCTDDTTTATRFTLGKIMISCVDTSTATATAGSETTTINSSNSTSSRPVRRALVGQKCLGGLRNILLIIFGYTLQLIHLQSQFYNHYPSSRSMLALSNSNNNNNDAAASGGVNQLAVPPERDVTTALQKALEDFKEMGAGAAGAGLDADSSTPIIDPEILKLLKEMTATAPKKRYDEYNCTLSTGVQISLPPVPTFIVAGVQKGGTSALHSLLRKHPLLVAPKKFEPHFFDSNPIMKSVNDTTLLSSGDICLLRELYSRNFKLHRLRRYPQMLSFEKTPSYMVTTEAPERIKVVAPWAKIIVTLRNPVDRYVHVQTSCHAHFVSRDKTKWSLKGPLLTPRHFPKISCHV